jgi:hypothetical protein
MAGKPWSEERKAQAAARRAAAKPAAAPKRAQNKASDNRLAVETALNTLSVPVMLLGRVNESFLADALTMQLAAEPLGAAAAEVARVNPAFEQFLSRGAPATPYLLLGTTLLSIGAQLAVNHGVKLGPLGGSATPRGEMIAEMKRRMAAAEQAAAADAAAYAQMAAEDAAYAQMAVEERERLRGAQEAADMNEVDLAAMSGTDAYEDSLAM